MVWVLAIGLIAGFSSYVEGCTTHGAVQRSISSKFNDDELAMRELDLFVKSCDALHDIVGNIGGMLEDIVDWYISIYKIPQCRNATACWVGEVEKLLFDWTEREELVLCIRQWNTVKENESRRRSTKWTTWSPCSKTCGNGAMTRTCHATPSRVQLRTVECGLQFSRRCSVRPCPMKSVTGNWGPWKESDVCSKSCGTGSQTWTRSCFFNDQPVILSRCKGISSASTIQLLCNTQSCPDGVWSAWRDEGSCSASCGSVGIQRQRRSCQNRSGQAFGACPGIQSRTRQCRAAPCSIGHWGPWKGIDFCSKSCGTGLQTWSRYCLVNNQSVSVSWCNGIAGNIQRPCKTQSCP